MRRRRPDAGGASLRLAAGRRRLPLPHRRRSCRRRSPDGQCHMSPEVLRRRGGAAICRDVEIGPDSVRVLAGGFQERPDQPTSDRHTSNCAGRSARGHLYDAGRHDLGRGASPRGVPGQSRSKVKSASVPASGSGSTLSPRRRSNGRPSLTRIGRSGSRQPSWTSSAIPTTTGGSSAPSPSRPRCGGARVGQPVAGAQTARPEPLGAAPFPVPAREALNDAGNSVARTLR